MKPTRKMAFRGERWTDEFADAKDQNLIAAERASRRKLFSKW